MPSTLSALDLAKLPSALRNELLSSLTNQQASELLYEWQFWARPNQLAPEGDWTAWVVLAGRGFGKSRSGAEWVRSQIENTGVMRAALVARTAADVRDVMVEGESGILAVCPPWNRPKYEPSKRRLTWPNGAIATTYTGDEPDLLRGPQHEIAWCDELAAWRYPEAFDQLRFGLRLGKRPRVCVTTTPQPVKHLKELLAEPGTVITRGSTYENRSNLAPAFFEQVIRKYEGTRLGRQELMAEILDDADGALWSRDMIDSARVRQAPEMARIVIGVDPAVTSGEESDETGIIVAGHGQDGEFYVMDDLTCRLSPDGWARRVVSAYDEYGAERVVAEVNNGGDFVEHVIRTIKPRISYRAVRATRGKFVRAEPIAALYEQGRVHHVGAFGTLEDQMCSFVPDSNKSPDHLDALVWALTELAEPARKFGVTLL